MIKTFDNKGDFGAYDAARNWLRCQGYTYGSMQGSAPIGIVRGDCYISKWRDMSEKERSELDGKMTAPLFFRDGPVTIEIKDNK